MVEVATTLEEIQAAISTAREAALAPLREQLKIVEARERLISSDLEETRELRKLLLRELRKLDPSMSRPGPKGKKAAGMNGTSANAEARHREAVAAAIVAINQVAWENPDGFTRTAVHSQMKANGVGVGDARMIRVMDELHSGGMITLHRLVTGGNKAFKRTEDISNGEPRPAN